MIQRHQFVINCPTSFDGEPSPTCNCNTCTANCDHRGAPGGEEGPLVLNKIDYTEICSPALARIVRNTAANPAGQYGEPPRRRVSGKAASWRVDDKYGRGRNVETPTPTATKRRTKCERQVCGWRQLGEGFQKDSQQTGSLR